MPAERSLRPRHIVALAALATNHPDLPSPHASTNPVNRTCIACPRHSGTCVLSNYTITPWSCHSSAKLPQRGQFVPDRIFAEHSPPWISINGTRFAFFAGTTKRPPRVTAADLIERRAIVTS
jgi:hypothetical protein